MHESVHVAPAAAKSVQPKKRLQTESTDHPAGPRTFSRRPCRAEDMLPVECATYVDEATKLLVSCSEGSDITEMQRNVDVVSRSWYRFSFRHLPRLRLNVMRQLLATCTHPKRFAADVCGDRIVLECWKSAGASASALQHEQPQEQPQEQSTSQTSGQTTSQLTKTKTKTKTYATVDAFPHVSAQDLKHVNEVLNALCKRYLFMKQFDVSIILRNTTVVVRACIRDTVLLDDLVEVMRDWRSLIYDIVLDFPNHSLNVYMRTSDAASSHLASERL